MDFNELLKQLIIFGAKVGTWSFGAAVVADKTLVNLVGDEWAFEDWKLGALAIFIAGLTHFGLRLSGLAEKDPANEGA